MAEVVKNRELRKTSEKQQIENQRMYEKQKLLDELNGIENKKMIEEGGINEPSTQNEVLKQIEEPKLTEEQKRQQSQELAEAWQKIQEWMEPKQENVRTYNDKFNDENEAKTYATTLPQETSNTMSPIEMKINSNVKIINTEKSSLSVAQPGNPELVKSEALMNQAENDTVGLFLQPQLMKPFMGEPSDNMFQSFMRENGDSISTEQLGNFISENHVETQSGEKNIVANSQLKHNEGNFYTL